MTSMQQKTIYDSNFLVVVVYFLSKKQICPVFLYKINNLKVDLEQIWMPICILSHVLQSWLSSILKNTNNLTLVESKHVKRKSKCSIQLRTQQSAALWDHASKMNIAVDIIRTCDTDFYTCSVHCTYLRLVKLAKVVKDCLDSVVQCLVSKDF